MKFNKIFVVLAILLLVIILFLLPYCSPKQKIVTVDCEKESLADAVRGVANTRFNVLGECTKKESVVITGDNIAIIGEGQTIIGNGTASVIEVLGAKNVIISDLTLTGGKHGIFIDVDSTVVLNDISANENLDTGIVIGSDIESEFPGGFDGQQGTDDTQESPVTGMLNKLNFSFISKVVASDPICSNVEGFIIPNSDSVFKIDGDRAVFCNTVTANSNAKNGVVVTQYSLLKVYGTLSASNNKNNAGLKVLRSTVDIIGSFETVGNSSFALNIVKNNFGLPPHPIVKCLHPNTPRQLGTIASKRVTTKHCP